ncbi:MAG: aspartate/glutamate racemase family protein, partial [Erythrobacter sp.]
VAGLVLDGSREAYRGVIERLAKSGAQGVVLGCTEIALLIGAADSSIPLFDTTALHASAAVRRALA